MRAGALALMMMIAVACRSRALDPATGSGTIGVDGGGGFSGRGDAALGPPRVLPLGLACAAPSDCSSGFCEDGFCCNKACVGSCLSCAVPGQVGLCKPSPVGAPARPGGCVIGADLPCGYDGTCDGTGACALTAEGTVCGAGQCDGSTVVGEKTCDGRGACRPSATRICIPYRCDPVTSSCRTDCTTDADCPGSTCEAPGRCRVNVSGSCQANDQCATGFCAQGVCCNAACDGPCVSCNVLGREGTCSPVGACVVDAGSADRAD